MYEDILKYESYLLPVSHVSTSDTQFFKHETTVHHKLIQTDYDSDFENWYENKYNNLIRKDLGQERKQSVVRIESNSRKCFSLHPQETRRDLSRCEFHYHKSNDIKDKTYWISLMAFDITSLQEYEKENDKKYDTPKCLIENSIAYPASGSFIDHPELKVQKSIFEDFEFEKKINQVIKCIRETNITEKMKGTYMNSKETQTIKYLKVLKDMKVLYEIDDDIIDEVTNKINNINIDFKLISNMAIEIHLHNDNRSQPLNYTNSSIFKKPRYYLNNFTTKYVDQVFYLNEKEYLLTSCKSLKINKFIKKDKPTKVVNLTLRNGTSVLNHHTLYPEHVERIMDLTRQLKEVLSVLQTLRNIDLELPSHTNILDKLVNDVICPKIYEKYECESFRNWSLHFKTNSNPSRKQQNFKINFKSSAISFFFTNSRKSKIPIIYSRNNKLTKKKSTIKHGKKPRSQKLKEEVFEKLASGNFSNMRELKLFDMPNLDVIDLYTIKKIAHEITKELKQILELVNIISKTYYCPMLRIANMMIPIDIDCTTLTIGVNKPSIELQFKLENYVKYDLNFQNLLNISFFKTHQHNQRKGFQDNFISHSVLIEKNFSDMKVMESKLNKILQCALSTKLSTKSVTYNKRKISQHDQETDMLLKGSEIQKQEKSRQKPSQKIAKEIHVFNKNLEEDNPHSDVKMYTRNQNVEKDDLLSQKSKNITNTCKKNHLRRLDRFKINRNIFGVCYKNWSTNHFTSRCHDSSMRRPNILEAQDKIRIEKYDNHKDGKPENNAYFISAISHSNSKYTQGKSVGQNCDSVMNLYLSMSSDTSVEAARAYSTEGISVISKLAYYLNQQDESKSNMKIAREKKKSGSPVNCKEKKIKGGKIQTKTNLNKNRKSEKKQQQIDSILNLYKDISSDTCITLSSIEFENSNQTEVKTKSQFRNVNFESRTRLEETASEKNSLKKFFMFNF